MIITVRTVTSTAFAKAIMRAVWHERFRTQALGCHWVTIEELSLRTGHNQTAIGAWERSARGLPPNVPHYREPTLFEALNCLEAVKQPSALHAQPMARAA